MESASDSSPESAPTSGESLIDSSLGSAKEAIINFLHSVDPFRNDQPEESKSVSQILMDDHKKVKGLFSDFSSSELEDEQLELGKQIVRELTIHSKLEEDVVYPAVKAEATEKGPVLEGYEEHYLIDRLVMELHKMTSVDEIYKAKMKVLSELVKHHIDEEEFSILPKVEDYAEQEALKSEFDKQRAELESKEDLFADTEDVIVLPDSDQEKPKRATTVRAKSTRAAVKSAVKAKPADKATAAKTKPAAKATAAKSKPATKAKAAAKAKPAAKATAARAKPVSKAKPAAKSKPAAKAKPASKAKPVSKAKTAVKTSAGKKTASSKVAIKPKAKATLKASAVKKSAPAAKKKVTKKAR